MAEQLENVVLSSNPCPICQDANGQVMTLDEWRESEYGLPGSSARYCEDECHCILVAAGLRDELDLGEHIMLRGDKGTDIPSIIEIRSNEQILKLLMEGWNKKIGKLPKEIYSMPVEEVIPYLKKLMARELGTEEVAAILAEVRD